MQVTKGKEGEGDVVHVTTKTNTTNSDKKPLIKKTADKYQRTYAVDSANQLLYLDGEEITVEEMRMISPDDIASINRLKGKATKSYGKAGENGVQEITSKKNKAKTITLETTNGNHTSLNAIIAD